MLHLIKENGRHQHGIDLLFAALLKHNRAHHFEPGQGMGPQGCQVIEALGEQLAQAGLGAMDAKASLQLTDLFGAEIGGIEILGLGHQPVHRPYAGHPARIGHGANRGLPWGRVFRARDQKQGRLGGQTLHQQGGTTARHNGPKPWGPSRPQGSKGLLEQPFDCGQSSDHRRCDGEKTFDWACRSNGAQQFL